MRDFKFSVVMLLDNKILSVNEKIDSVIEQNLNFKKNIQLILVDLGSSDETYEVAEEYQLKYPENIVLIQHEKDLEGRGKYFNIGLDEARGDYILFFNYRGNLSKNAFTSARDYISKYHDEVDIFSIPVSYYDKKTDSYLPKIDYLNQDIIDVNENIDHSSIRLGASFIKRKSIGDLRFDEDLLDCENTLFLTEILLKKEKFALLRNAKIESNRRTNVDKEERDKEYVNNKFRLFFDRLMKYSNKRYIKYLFLIELNPISRIPYLGEVFETKEEIDEFWKKFMSILDLIDMDDLQVHDEIPRITRSFFVYLKNNAFNIELWPDSKRVFLKSNDYVINGLHHHMLRIDIVEMIGNTLNLSGSLSSNCYPENLSVKLTREFSDGKKDEFIGKFVEYPTTNRSIKRFLDYDWQFPYNFDFKIPLSDGEISKFNFALVYHDDETAIEMPNSLEFREFAGLSFIGNYLIKNDRTIFFRGKTFYIEPYSYSKMFELEAKSIVRMLRFRGSFLLQGLFYRIVHFLLFPFWKNKKIWLFVDRDIFADDNAEHLFKYCIKQDDGINKYFILNKDSPDFERLNKDYDIVPFGSFKHKINYLFSEKIMISQVTRGILNPFTHENNTYYEGLSTYKFCFLQHGVTKDDISWWIKKYHKNLYLFVTVSDLERESMVNGHYNYEEDRIPVLGFPRYDNLSSDPKKEILFIPTWRRNLDNPKDIMNSDYLKNLNSFLNNEKLKNAISDMGYTLVFRPHPELWKFLELFNLEDVRLSEEPYQEMFKTASLMITDYSSVAFDFAYLKKPVIYYQDGEYHYGEGYYDYETMGFGKVTFDEDELVDIIIEYMKNDCVMEDEYKSRVDSFFKYNDRNNCKRTYEWLLKH